MLSKEEQDARHRLELEARQKEMRRENPVWREMQDTIIDYDDIAEKKAARVEEANEREREYKRQLEEMQSRVQHQPTLFQRQSRVSQYRC